MSVFERVKDSLDLFKISLPLGRQRIELHIVANWCILIGEDFSVIASVVSCKVGAP